MGLRFVGLRYAIDVIWHPMGLCQAQAPSQHLGGTPLGVSA